MKIKWLFLSVLALSLVYFFGYRPETEQLRASAMAAINAGHDEVAQHFAKAGSDSEDTQASLTTPSKADDADVASTVSKMGAGSEELRKSLLKAIRADNTDAAERLIKLGADVNSRTSENGWSALHYAVRNGNAKVVELLLSAGADPNYLGTMEGQATGSTISLRPLVLAQAALDLVNQIPRSNIEETLRQSGLDDPALVKSMKDPNAADRYKKVVEVLATVTKQS